MAKQKFTEEGYPILNEFVLEGGGIARMVEFPKVELPEPDEEEKWYMNLDDEFKFGEDLDERIFQYENFNPEKCEKDVGSGAWIMVKTDIGYNVYFAKKSKKVIDESSIKRKINRLTQKQKDPSMQVLLSDQAKIAGQKADLYRELLIAKHIERFGQDPQYVKVQRTKTQVRYLLPCEYKIIDDIQLYIDAVTDSKVKRAVKFKALFTAKQNDAIFYMQSRGIKKEVAEMMANLQHGYFVCDTQAMFCESFYQVEKDSYSFLK